METKIFIVKTQVGQEENVANMFEKAAKRSGKIAAILAPKELRGYIFVESEDINLIKTLIRHMKYARDVLEKDIKIEEIELVSGPFKGEKAKVTRIDDTKEEITVELLDAMVPIPITVRGEQVRILKKKEEE